MRFGSNPQGWFSWVMDHISLQPGNRVLECGCGPGWLWRHNLDKIPEGCQITLTDLSVGMVAEAEEALSATNIEFRFLDSDITRLPFDDHGFDVVIANHMLYHVSERKKALHEVGRVLKGDGKFIAATIGSKHMVELRDLQYQIDPEYAVVYQQMDREFSLENGHNQLAEFFDGIKLLLYENNLRVTDAAALIEYILSSVKDANSIPPKSMNVVSESIQRNIDEKGFYEVTTSSGLFTATNRNSL